MYFWYMYLKPVKQESEIECAVEIYFQFNLPHIQGLLCGDTITPKPNILVYCLYDPMTNFNFKWIIESGVPRQISRKDTTLNIILFGNKMYDTMNVGKHIQSAGTFIQSVWDRLDEMFHQPHVAKHHIVTFVPHHHFHRISFRILLL